MSNKFPNENIVDAQDAAKAICNNSAETPTHPQPTAVNSTFGQHGSAARPIPNGKDPSVETFEFPLELTDESNLKAFDLAMRRLRQIKHPNFIGPMEWGVGQKTVFVQRRSDVLTNTCLYQVTGSTQGKISGCIELAKALAELHESNCLQREFLPENLLATREGWKLACSSPLAFCNPKRLDENTALKFAQTSSPEFTGAITADLGPPSDIYSLGVVFFNIFAGDYPFFGNDVHSQLIQHLTKEPNWELLKNTPLVLTNILKHMLRKEPAKRYQTAQSVVDDLTALQEQVGAGQFEDTFVAGRTDTRRAIEDPVFVGRSNELEQMNRFLSKTEFLPSNKIVIVAESGIGKSRFVSESLKTTNTAGIKVFRAGAKERVGEHPMAVVRSIAHQAISHPTVVDRLKQRLSPFRNEIRLLAPQLANSLGFASNSTQVESQGNSRANQTKQALIEFFQCLGNDSTPAVIWVDDCQWLDHQVSQVFDAIDSAKTNVKFIFSTRIAKANQLCFSKQIKDCAAIQIGALQNDEVRLLTESMAGQLPEDAVDFVVRFSEGSPLMAAAILRGMDESGAIYFHNKQWEINREKWSTISAGSSSAAILANRISDLPEPTKETLLLAAVYGREFDLELLTSCAPGEMPPEEIDSQLQIARDQKMIWQLPNAEFAFVHDKIRETLMEVSTAEKQKELHLAIANHLQYSQIKDSFKIAFHFDQAGFPERGLADAIKSARDSRSQCALKAAKDFLEIAVRGQNVLEGRNNHCSLFEIRMELAEVCMLIGQYQSAKTWLEEASMLAAEPDQKGKVNAKLGELEFKVGDKLRAVSHFEQAIESLNRKLPSNRFSIAYSLAKEIGIQCLHSLLPGLFLQRIKRQPTDLEKLEWRLYSRLAHSYWYTKDQWKTVWTHLITMNRSELFAPTPELAQAYSEHAPAMSLIPTRQRGENYAQRSVKLREEFGDLWGQGQSHGFHSILLYSVSAFEDCIEKALIAESILQKTGDQWEINIARYQRAASHFRLGQFPEAIEICQSTYQSALVIGDYQSTANIIDVWARSVRGEFPREVLNREMSRDIQDSQARCQVLLAAGVDSFFRYQFTDAIEYLESGIKIAKNDGIINAYITPLYAWLASAKRIQWERNPGKSRQVICEKIRSIYHSARLAMRCARRFKNDLPHALREMAFAKALLGRSKSAKRCLEQSINVARTQNALFELAESLRAYATLGSEYGWREREEASNEADTIFSKFETPKRPERRKTTLSLIDVLSH